MTTRHDDHEPFHDASPTSTHLDELQLYGHRPHDDEPDPRPLPEERIVRGALADIFDAFVSTLQDTRLEPDLDAIEAKRRQNTLAARRSRKRKLEYQRELESNVDRLQDEKEQWKRRAEALEAVMRSHGIEVPPAPAFCAR